MELIVAILDWIVRDAVLTLIYILVWAILLPSALVLATPLVLVIALIQSGSFRENARRQYGTILREFCGMRVWIRTRRAKRDFRSS